MPVSDVTPPSTYGSAFASNAGLTANTAQQVFSAASNTKGAWVNAANAMSYSSASVGTLALIAKSSAPANVADGDVIALSGAGALMTGNLVNYLTQGRVFIPAGKGLYFISSITESGGTRSATYTLL